VQFSDGRISAKQPHVGTEVSRPQHRRRGAEQQRQARGEGENPAEHGCILSDRRASSSMSHTWHINRGELVGGVERAEEVRCAKPPTELLGGSWCCDLGDRSVEFVDSQWKFVNSEQVMGCC